MFKIPCKLASIALIVCMLSGCVLGGRTGLDAGESPPNFTLNDIYGRPVSLSSYNGQVILLNFWASWCNPCVSEMPEMERLYRKLKHKGFVVIAIGVDDEVASLRAFSDKYGLSFPILVDSTGIVRKQYKIRGLPESYIIDRHGKVVMMPDIGNDQPVVKIIGPRNWDSPTAESRLMELIRAQ